MRQRPEEKLVRSTRTFLARWQDVALHVRPHGPSHGHLQIVLGRGAEYEGENLTISLDPAWWHGPFAWEGARLAVELVATDPPLFTLTDAAADFECRTGWFEVKEHVRLLTRRF